MEDCMTDSKRPLESCRSYLHLLARLRLRALPRKLDASDIVQDVLLKAHARHHQFRGQSEGEWRAWLWQILANTVADALRDPGYQPMIRDALEKSSLRLEAWLAAEHTSPSGKAERAEKLIHLADTLAKLGEDERTAIELRYLEEPAWSLHQIAKQLKRPTAKAVAGVLARALKKLRGILPDES
jgi:RNA polymerase sigma-70 factor, ECF subfamily